MEEVPSLHWLLALLFLGVGLIFVAGPLGLMRDLERVPAWQRALAVGLGAVGVATGLWTLAGAPRSRLVMDPVRGRMRLEQRGLGGRTVQEWPLAALAAVELVESRDDEGGEVFRLHLVLRDPPPVLASPVWRHGREAMESVARQVAAAAGVGTVNVRPGVNSGPRVSGA